MSRVYWDSMVFIYLLEENPVFSQRVLKMHEAMRSKSDRLCTSIFTVGEVLTGPRKRNDRGAVRGLHEFFGSGQIEILPFDMEAADRYSTIRAEARVSQADGIHLATASAAGVDIFITNDKKLRALQIRGIGFFADLEGRVF